MEVLSKHEKLYNGLYDSLNRKRFFLQNKRILQE